MSSSVFKLGYPLELADDFLLMIRRIAQSENIPINEQWTMFYIARGLVEVVAEDLIELNDAQQLDYEALLAELENIDSLLRSMQNPILSIEGFIGVKRRDFIQTGAMVPQELASSKEDG